MKSLIIYSSTHHGNTKKIAAVIAETLGADLLQTDEVKSNLLKQYDLIGFGSGIFNGKHHAKLYQTIEKAKIKGKSVFVFSTSGTGNNKYNKSLIDHLTSNGALVKNSFSCKGFDTYGIFKWIGGIAKGHPDSKDIESARNFAKALLN
ncbi:MAG TPA: flavodoxin family protein [Clostridia bacterium]|nr:flavodoxin family protein [Clostridia bacterium]